MKRRWGLGVLLGGLLLENTGCSAVGGVTGSIGPLINLALYAAMIAAPFALGYYLYTKRD